MDFEHSLWGRVVPDGSRFCHWGGKALSQRLAVKLNLCGEDRVLDLCCGEGGLTDYLGVAQSVVGIDISHDAIVCAQKTARHANTTFVTADALALPFPDKSFTKLVSQDADAWMHVHKQPLMREIARILKPGGLFVWQSYISNEHCLNTTHELLSAVGYSVSDMPRSGEVASMFRDSGFVVRSIDCLHDIYANDNLRMLARARQLQESVCASRRESATRLLRLLEWEHSLFKKRLWSGVLVTAHLGSDT